jgi:hypothetical protein
MSMAAYSGNDHIRGGMCATFFTASCTAPVWSQNRLAAREFHHSGSGSFSCRTVIGR